MESQENDNYPPANAITQDEKDYPIIRCEDCHELLFINFNLNKKEIQLICEKEKKTKNIPFDTFFETLDKYKDMNCCEFCKNKNPSQIYYLCKECSKKILCENCFNEHDKKHDTIKLKIDSTCRKHYNPYDSYCPKCKEHKCSYCSIDHDESHEKDEFTLKKKLFKKNKIDAFKANIKRINNLKKEIEQKINSLIKELEDKIKLINNLRNNFFESLDKQMKFSELMLDNYEKKLKDFDLNYYNISNLEKQINFNLLQLNYNENNSLDKKIEIITQYLNQNLNAQFIFCNDKMDKNENFESAEKINEINGLIYENISELNKAVNHFVDFNKALFIFCTENCIYLLSKENLEAKIVIKESEIKNIEFCKKIDDDNFFIQIPKYIVFFKIFNNNNYMITQKYSFPCKYFDFNSKLDLIYMEDNNSYYKSNNIYYTTYSKINSLNNYDANTNVSYDGRLQFIKNNSFFYFYNNIVQLFEIQKKNYGHYNISFQGSTNLDYNYNNATIIDLSEKFYCLNDGRKILLLNKNKLALSKTISMNSNNLKLLQITDDNITIFEKKDKNLILNNYDILMDGLDWNLKGSKNILNEEVHSVEMSNNYFICKTNKACILFEIRDENNN